MTYNQDINEFKGIDIPINKLKDVFQSNLFDGFNYISHGQVYINDDQNKPEIYNSTTGDYQDVLTNDNYDAISFFKASEQSQYINNQTWENETNIYFWINLKIVKDSKTYRAIEDVVDDIYKLLKIYGIFEIQSRVIGRSAFEDFNLPDLKSKNMQPYCLISFNTILKYK